MCLKKSLWWCTKGQRQLWEWGDQNQCKNNHGSCYHCIQRLPEHLSAKARTTLRWHQARCSRAPPPISETQIFFPEGEEHYSLTEDSYRQYRHCSLQISFQINSTKCLFTTILCRHKITPNHCCKRQWEVESCICFNWTENGITGRELLWNKSASSLILPPLLYLNLALLILTTHQLGFSKHAFLSVDQYLHVSVQLKVSCLISQGKVVLWKLRFGCIKSHLIASKPAFITQHCPAIDGWSREINVYIAA